MSRRVLQIGYDEALMVTRELLLEKRGYEVVSVLGDSAAKEVLSRGGAYDLFIVGHAASADRRRNLVQWLKINFPDVKVVSLNPPHQGGVPHADYNIPLDGPEEWLRAVRLAIG
jgi:hypothetical protein